MAFSLSLARHCFFRTCQRNTRTYTSCGSRSARNFCYGHLSGALPTATCTAEASSSAGSEGSPKSITNKTRSSSLPSGATQEQSDQVGPTKRGRTKSSNADEADDMPKKAGAKKKRQNSPEISNQMMREQLLGPFVPFEGTNNLQNGSLSVSSQDSLEGRLYHIRSNDLDRSTYSFPSVTTVLDNTVGRGSYYRLLSWKRKLTAEHGTEGFEKIVKNTLNSGSNFHKDLENKLLQLSESRTIGSSSSNSQPELLKELSPAQPPKPPTASPSGETADEGTQICTLEQSSTPESPATTSSCSNEDEEASDRDEDTSDEPPPSRHMQSVEHVLKDIGKVVALETPVAHLELGYVGTFDCLAEYRGQLCLIDWKTSTRPRPTLADCYDYPLQAVAYAGAINQDSSIGDKVLNLLIVVAYASGEPAHTHLIDHQLCQKYWLKWLHRLQTYQTMFAEDLSEIIT